MVHNVTLFYDECYKVVGQPFKISCAPIASTLH